MKRRILNIAVFRKETLYQKMRALIIYLVISAVFIGCTPILSIDASTQSVYHFSNTDKNISLLDISETFGTYDGSFVCMTIIWIPGKYTILKKPPNVFRQSLPTKYTMHY